MYRLQGAFSPQIEARAREHSRALCDRARNNEMRQKCRCPKGLPGKSTSAWSKARSQTALSMLPRLLLASVGFPGKQSVHGLLQRFLSRARRGRRLLRDVERLFDVARDVDAAVSDSLAREHELELALGRDFAGRIAHFPREAIGNL
jgi:hypothetical protein